MAKKPTHEELEKKIQELEREAAEYKHADKKLQESEPKFRTLFDLIPQAIVLAEVDTGVLIDVNRKYCELTKYSKEEIIGRTAAELGLFSEEDRNRFLRELQVSGDVQGLEMDFKVKDGTILNALLFSKIIQLSNKTFTLNICIDVTEQKHAEEELKKSEDFNRTLFKYNPIQTIAVDLKGRIVDYNIAKEQSGDRLPDIGNVMYKDYAGRHKENMYAAMMDSIKRGELKEFPALKYKDKFLSVTIAPYPYGAIITSQNITERIALEERLAHAEKMEAIGTLAGGIAHDYNNLLAVILGNIDLIELSAQPGSEMDRSLSHAKEACMRAKDLAHKLITFSKGGAPVKRVASIIEMLKESSDFALAGSNVNCEFYISDNLWPVEYDENQMKHVINNLITNADQGMPDGGTIRVSAENIPIGSEDKDPILQLPAGKYIKISIQDHGIGIPPERLSRVFDPYFSTKERGTQKGMGMGLATVYSIINKHNGQVTVESEEGAGSTFHIYLPAAEAEGMELRAKGGYEVKQSTIPPGRKPLRAGGINQQSPRVLVMDDEEMLRNLADQMLNRLGYDIETAKNGSEAIELYKQAMNAGKPFDAVILDLTIKGGMGGKGAVKALLKIDPQVKAIVASGYSNDPVITDFKQYGFMDALVKPHTMEDLGNALDKIMGGS